MRLGQDALVLTKHTTSQSVGFLSQTFLKVGITLPSLPQTPNIDANMHLRHDTIQFNVYQCSPYSLCYL